ncbi:hypothetical protein PTNB85_09956 [Pyrenophora teres f. teres]|nr:hypothetical protein PTNB85_09956 [Pyrenophora teres f. teres]KAE8852479.1 hypothetical protein PTNB29_10380 [Pyrenophora teres f. teres]
MHLVHALPLALSLLSPLATATKPPTFPPLHIPANITKLPVVPPGFNFLYTMQVNCKAGLYDDAVPHGIRTAIPIVEGEFRGPRLNGRVINLGADWGLTDPRTNIFSADTRYQIQTYDGAWIYVRTSGASQPGGESHLRVVFETGDRRYYWLNSVVSVAVLNTVLDYEGGYWLQIDVWNLGKEWTETPWVNGTTA